MHPKRITAVSDPNFSFWHSAMFNNAGDKVIFDDEWGGGSQPRCRAQDPMTWGADSIFTLKNRELTLGSYYKMPAPQTENENCTAHNGSIIPIPGRDIEVKSWYQGGISIMDFTDATHPFEIAYFDRGPLDDNKFIDGGEWSAYWYNGYIYGSEIARGLDVFKLTPSKFVSQAEIDAAQQVHLAEFNAQAPTKIVYPANFVTAKAYVDAACPHQCPHRGQGNGDQDGHGQEERQGLESLRGDPREGRSDSSDSGGCKPHDVAG